jgi:hypothetical protein
MEFVSEAVSASIIKRWSSELILKPVQIVGRDQLGGGEGLESTFEGCRQVFKRY